MNKVLLNNKVQEFIKNHLNSDLNRLILKGSPFEEISIQELAQQIKSLKKSQKKLPSWFHTKNIYYPKSLHIEQSSSEQTANYKLDLVRGNSLIDITGGFGVDSFYFSKKMNSVVYCELNNDLFKIASHNFEQLGVKNIQTHCCDGLDYLRNTHASFDFIYADPSRRNEQKGRVFMLEDCLPNIPEQLDLLFGSATNILLKTAPLLDISMAVETLKHVKEVHVVAVKNEVKELLFLLNKQTDSEITIHTVNFENNNTQQFSFKLKNYVSIDYELPMKYIYEPNSAILKSGGFNALGCALAIAKLHPNSHLYTSAEKRDFPGRRFELLECLPLKRKLFTKKIPEKKANITVRNFPQNVVSIRKKYKIKEGGDLYLFFTTDKLGQHCVLKCIRA